MEEKQKQKTRLVYVFSLGSGCTHRRVYADEIEDKISFDKEVDDFLFDNRYASVWIRRDDY